MSTIQQITIDRLRAMRTLLAAEAANAPMTGIPASLVDRLDDTAELIDRILERAALTVSP